MRRRHCANERERVATSRARRRSAARTDKEARTEETKAWRGAVRRGEARRGEARRGENSRNGGEPNIGKCRRATGHVRTVDERDRGGGRVDERARGTSRRGHGERYYGTGCAGRSWGRRAGLSSRGLHHRRSELYQWHDLQRHHLGSAAGIRAVTFANFEASKEFQVSKLTPNL